MTSASRETILRSIRKQRVPEFALPELAGPWIEYPDRVKQFGEALAFVGGKLERAANLDEARARIHDLPAYHAAKQICCCVPGVAEGNVILGHVAEPHELEKVELAVMPGEFGVAENGAVWVTGEHLRHRVIYFLTQHLVLVVPAAELVNNMYQAYQRISFAGPDFGTFISGPSKTADIEQSLVIGAHGARSLTVILVG